MTDNLPFLERACFLARSGECQTVPAIRTQLIAEGYRYVGGIHSKPVRDQLTGLIAAAASA
jgi:hypothetical protein